MVIGYDGVLGEFHSGNEKPLVERLLYKRWFRFSKLKTKWCISIGQLEQYFQNFHIVFYNIRFRMVN